MLQYLKDATVLLAQRLAAQAGGEPVVRQHCSQPRALALRAAVAHAPQAPRKASATDSQSSCKPPQKKNKVRKEEMQHE